MLVSKKYLKTCPIKTYRLKLVFDIHNKNMIDDHDITKHKTLQKSIKKYHKNYVFFFASYFKYNYISSKLFKYD